MNGSLRIRKKSTLKSFIDKSESTYNNSSKAFFSLKNSVLEKIQRFENSNINVTDDIFKQKSIYGAPLQISTNLFGRVCNIPRIVDSTVNFLLNHCLFTSKKKKTLIMKLIYIIRFRNK